MPSTCCSSAEVAESSQIPVEVTTSAWRGQLLEDLGSDVQAVARDFPRMMVFVNTGAQHNYDTTIRSGGAERAQTGSQDGIFMDRLKRVKDTVLLIAELCGEETTYGQDFCKAWESKIKTDSSDQCSDIHSLMHGSLLASNMIEEVAENKWTVHSNTFVVLLFTVQGIMFYPSQYLDSRIRTPWMSHMQDNGWSIHIYPASTSSPSSLKGSLVVQHRQATRHYVEEKNGRIVPRFELQYSCTFSIEPQLGRNHGPSECSNAVKDISFDLVDARLEIPRCSCFARLWQARARELQNKVESFGISMAPCKRL